MSLEKKVYLRNSTIVKTMQFLENSLPAVLRL